MKRKPVIWYVDDLPENLRKFENDHKKLTVRTFSTTSDVIDALSDSTPDALLCDIFFYETVQLAKDIEGKVKEKAEELRTFGITIGATEPKNLAGIDLIETVSHRFRTRFPIYAYTSKGPYLLGNTSFDRIGESGARWLFKGKYSPSTQEMIIREDIEEFQQNNSLSRRMGRFFWVALFGSGILGGLVVWLLTEVLPKWL